MVGSVPGDAGLSRVAGGAGVTGVVGAAFTVAIKGLDELNGLLRRAIAQAPDRAGAALFREAETIMGISKTYVPVDKGILRASGHVALPEVRGSSVSVTLGYGGAAASYAIPVHEIPPPPAQSPGGRSARHRPPTQWKYLERAVLERAGVLHEALARDMGRLFEGA